MSVAARSSVRAMRAAPLAGRRAASNIPPVGSGSPDPQTTTTSSRPGVNTVDRRAGGSVTPWVAGIVLLGAGAYFYLQNDDSARAKVKKEAHELEAKTKDLYGQAKSETKSVFGQAESQAKGYRREAENRGEDILESAKARASEVKKDAQEGWFKAKSKASETAEDAKDAFSRNASKVEDRARSAYDSARSSTQSAASDLNARASRLIDHAALTGEQVKDEASRWYYFGKLKAKEGEKELDRAGNRLNKETGIAENRAKSWWFSAKSTAEDLKADAKSKL